MRVNVVGTLSLADLCSVRGIHMTLFATGCIYEYDEAHPVSPCNAREGAREPGSQGATIDTATFEGV